MGGNREGKIKKHFLVSIKSKLIFMMLGVSIIPLILLALINIKTLKNEVEESIHKEHELTASKISQTVVEMVKTTQESLETMGMTNLGLFDGDNKYNREDIIYRMLKRYHHLEEISMIAPNGMELVKISKRYAISPKELRNISEEEKFQILKQGNLYIGKPEIDLDNQIVFELGIPVGGNQEYLTGAIIAKMSLRQIMKKINSTKTKEGSYIILIDDAGSLIGHSDYSQVTRRQDVTKSRGVKNLLKIKTEKDKDSKYEKFETMIYESYLGENVLGVYGLIPIVDWGVVVEQPLDSAYANIRLVIAKIGITFVLTILMIALFGSFLIYLFMKPVEELEKGVDSVKSGNFDYKIPRRNNDEIGKVIEAFNDMTEEIKKRRENESLIMIAEKRAAIGTLAAGVAHEINNPMNNLGFYATDLLERLETEDINFLYSNKIIQNYLEIIKEQISRCSAITQNLLKFSRESKVNIKLVNISKIIEDILKLMEHRLKKQNIDIVFKIDSIEPIILADESQMQQMLLNIITNAVDAMEDKGTLTIDIKEIDDNLLLLSISDTGYGIKEQDKGRIFDPFYTTKPIGKGTGLGLSISQAIVERMRGSIEIHSKENIGTKVLIKLPISKEVEGNGEF
ncbi:sensor histidine kinase [Tissierella praeacuta]|uniref:histidine kinase n=1 Tax=Tissierella praeacuta DSM 18095 TaxID=1123404 RepID=A0A1M4TM74_9FIRM|nr:ATP-binding protein [Tissierella praeacuta]MBU5256871.1 HAMP domain-containing protein [Tissierella praeacuta]TCU77449.1 two-component system NtrC family sensor kinase [Tissierella praeacuta]SHE45560.1 two-component system, NtrC family, sensor kinase [Tissierella praeacuta DSM 18095]SUP04502.1 Sporulation kinase E [Tissierella praeacuta]